MRHPIPGLRYPFAVLVTVAAVTLRGALEPVLGGSAPLMLLLIAPTAAALYGGLGPGLLAGLLSGALGVTLFVSPVGAPLPPDAREWLRLAIFVALAVVISWVIDARARAVMQYATEHRRLARLQEGLAARERRVREIIEASPSAMLLLDAAGRFEFVNAQAERLFGYAREEFAQLTIEDLLPERFRGSHATQRSGFWHEPIARPMGAGRDLYARRKDGSEVAVEIGLSPVAGDEGPLVLASITDITSRKRAELAERAATAQLRRSEAHLASVYRQTAAGLAELDEHGYFVVANDSFCELVGRTREDLLQTRTQDITHPDDLPRNLELLERLLASGEPFSMEKRYVRPDGSAVWVAINVNRITVPGAGTRVLGVAVDVSERKAVEAQLRDLQERFRVAVEAASDIVWTTDPRGRMDGEQPSWSAFTGQSRREYAGYGWIGAVHPEDAGASLAAWHEAVAGGVRYAFEHRLRRRDGAFRTFTIRALPVRDASGSVREWVGVHTDITDLREAGARLQEADRRKDEFLATLAHELRNPLAPLRNSLEVLDRSDDPAVIAPLRAMMHRQLAQLVRLVDDLLEVSRITTGKLKLHRERIPLRSVLEAALENARPQLDGRHHRLALELGSAEVWLDGDAVRLAQVFTNLLNNAAKYTDEGGTITVRVATPRPDRVRVAVSDTGIGIDRASLDRVFDLFAQVDRGSDKAQGGLGIGLSLARRLVEMHGGTIGVHSAGVGRGSTFTVELPAEFASGASGEPEAADAGDGGTRCSVVVADDNRDAADSLALMLGLGGHRVQTAYDGREAIHAVRAHRPHVVILDIGMPECDGYGVARALRQEPWGDGLVLIALTGWGQDADKERTAAAGFDYHFTKPVDPDRIEQVLGSLERCRRPSGEAVDA